MSFIKERAADGGMAHHRPHPVGILGLRHPPKLAELVEEKIHLPKEHILIGDEKLAPHQIVDPGNAGQIAEGVPREALHILLFAL